MKRNSILAWTFICVFARLDLNYLLLSSKKQIVILPYKCLYWSGTNSCAVWVFFGGVLFFFGGSFLSGSDCRQNDCKSMVSIWLCLPSFVSVTSWDKSGAGVASNSILVVDSWKRAEKSSKCDRGRPNCPSVFGLCKVNLVLAPWKLWIALDVPKNAQLKTKMSLMFIINCVWFIELPLLLYNCVYVCVCVRMCVCTRLLLLHCPEAMYGDGAWTSTPDCQTPNIYTCAHARVADDKFPENGNSRLHVPLVSCQRQRHPRVS